MAQDKLPEPGEFTRIFKRQHLGGQNGADAEKPSEISGVFKAAESDSALSAPPPAPAPPFTPSVPPPATASGEPGEFTQFFMGGGVGLPPPAPKTQRTPSNVQRPNSPVASRPLTGDSSGSFTDRFAAPAASLPAPKTEEFGIHNPRSGPVPDLSKKPQSEETGPFDFRPTVPRAQPSKQDSPGEYTSLFGPGAAPPQPKQSAMGQAPAAPIMSDSLQVGRNAPIAAPRTPELFAPPSPSRPSEYTEVIRGRQGTVAAGGGGADGAASGIPAGSMAGAKKIPLNVNVSPINPLQSLAGGAGLHVPSASASVGISGAHVQTPLGGASLQAPHIPPLAVPAGAGAGISGMSAQTKLLLFFAVLAILAVILVVVLVATQKN